MRISQWTTCVLPIKGFRVEVTLGCTGSSVGKESACNAGDTGDVGLIPGTGRFLEEGMATHSSILAWRIPWTEEPGGLQSTGSQRVRHDWAGDRWIIQTGEAKRDRAAKKPEWWEEQRPDTRTDLNRKVGGWVALALLWGPSGGFLSLFHGLQRASS